MGQTDTLPEIQIIPLTKLTLEDSTMVKNAGLTLAAANESYFKAQSSLEKHKLLPDLSLEYFQGTNSALNQSLIGYQLGVKIPLFFQGNASRIKASRIAYETAVQKSKDYVIRLQTHKQQLIAELKKYGEALTYYEKEGTQLAKEILNTAQASYRSGEIDFFQYLTSIENASEIELEYLTNLNLYNQTVIEINNLTL